MLIPGGLLIGMTLFPLRYEGNWLFHICTTHCGRFAWHQLSNCFLIKHKALFYWIYQSHLMSIHIIQWEKQLQTYLWICQRRVHTTHGCKCSDACKETVPLLRDRLAVCLRWRLPSCSLHQVCATYIMTLTSEKLPTLTHTHTPPSSVSFSFSPCVHDLIADFMLGLHSDGVVTRLASLTQSSESHD
jgi:hypothetical protein